MFSIRSLTGVALVGLALLCAGCGNKAPVAGEAKQEGQPGDRPPARAARNADLKMDVVCDTNPELRITRVKIGDAKTVIDMTFKSERIGNMWATARVRTGAPGQQSAFYLADPESRAEYRLLNVEGISLEPRWTELREGDVLHFTLTFERIPDHLTRVHVIEGKVQALSEDGVPAHSWTFMNVKLR